MSDFWYNALNTAKQPGGGTGPGPGVAAVPTIPGGSPNQSIGEDLIAIVRSQATELQRLGREHQDLIDRLDTVLQFQKREQVLLLTLQEQVDRLTDQVENQPPAIEPGTISQEVRSAVTADLQPILVAIVDLLEIALRMGSAQPQTVSPGVDQEVSPSEDFHRLPDILTRSLDELPIDGNGAGRRSAAEFIKRAVASLAQPPARPRPPRADGFSLTRVPS